MKYVREEIAAIEGYVPGEQPQGGKYIKLNTNENPYPCSPAVTRAIVQAAEAGLAKYPDPLATAFRRRAGEVLGVDPEWILCGNGSDDILTIATRTFVSPGELVRFPYPSYILYKTLAEIQGAQAEMIPFQADWSLNESFVAPADRLKLVYLPNPNSPTGTVLPRAAILDIANALPCPLLVDEAYADFAEWNCVDLVRENEKIIVSRTLSKSYALAGLRFGFAIAQPQMIEQLRKVKDSYNCDALSIAAATAAVDDQTWLAENRAKVIATRRRLIDGMRDLGFHAVESQANFVWNVHESLPLRPIYEKLKAEKILVRYMDYAGWGDGLRISVGTDEQNEACLAMLQRMV
ncbi:MAG: histidinol-phosphate transaminase [Planctomycetales bacterium]|nr:histidinol-phosphate transaminase [Planctomycetales bacterium]